MKFLENQDIDQSVKMMNQLKHYWSHFTLQERQTVQAKVFSSRNDQLSTMFITCRNAQISYKSLTAELDLIKVKLALIEQLDSGEQNFSEQISRMIIKNGYKIIQLNDNENLDLKIEDTDFTIRSYIEQLESENLVLNTIQQELAKNPKITLQEFISKLQNSRSIIEDKLQKCDC
jgi:hypothetical protein